MANRTTQPSTSLNPPELTLLPEPDAWPSTLAPSESPQAISIRSQLDLPTDRPIVASGHQSILFHPGIVAKLIALDHWSKRTGAASVWVVPDQDVVDPALVQLPDLNGDLLSSKSVRIGGEPNVFSPAASLPAISINPDLPSELESVGTWLMGYEHESSLARQFASATIGMLCEQLDLEEPAVIFASDLLSLDASSALLGSMLDDPNAAIDSYNASVAEFPHAGVRPLSMTDSRIELPFWRLVGSDRLPVFIETARLSEFDRNNLIPRGLMMTAIMRAFASDLFIHGTGGYEYDQITEHWFNNWLGRTVAPAVGVSATLTLGLDLPGSLPDPDHSVWLAHHARHNPGLVGDHEAASRKAELVSAITQSKSKGNQSNTATLFAQLHQLLSDSIASHSTEIADLDHAAERAQQSREAHRLASDRTWAFPLYSDQQLLSLKSEIVRALGANG